MIIPVGFGQVTLIYNGAGQPEGAANVFGVDLGLVLDIPLLAADIGQLFEDEFGPLLHQDTRVGTVKIKLGPNDVGPEYVVSGDWAGTVAGGCSPPQVAYLLRKSTGLGGRRNRGRMYLPGVPEGNVSDTGVLVSGTQSALDAAASDFLAGLASLDAPMVLLHNGASDPTPVTSLDAQSRVATQRNRLR